MDLLSCIPYEWPLVEQSFSPANPPFPVSDDFEPPGEQIRDDRPAGLHRLLLHHPQGEAQRDHAAQHRAEPRRLLQLDAQEARRIPKKSHVCISCASTYCKWSEACTKPVLPASEPWPTALESTRVFVQLHIWICAIVQMYLCNPVTTVCAHVHALNTFLCTLCIRMCSHSDSCT